MGTIERDSGMNKLRKTAKELEGMLRSALQEKHGAIIDDLNIRVFRTKADLPDWNAEIVGGERVVEDGIPWLRLGSPSRALALRDRYDRLELAPAVKGMFLMRRRVFCNTRQKSAFL